MSLVRLWQDEKKNCIYLSDYFCASGTGACNAGDDTGARENLADQGHKRFGFARVAENMVMGVVLMPNECFEIRRDGDTVCVSSVPRCGYSAKLLREMMADGYRYYVNGKLQRKVE